MMPMHKRRHRRTIALGAPDSSRAAFGDAHAAVRSACVSRPFEGSRFSGKLVDRRTAAFLPYLPIWGK